MKEARREAEETETKISMATTFRLRFHWKRKMAEMKVEVSMGERKLGGCREKKRLLRLSLIDIEDKVCDCANNRKINEGKVLQLDLQAQT